MTNTATKEHSQEWYGIVSDVITLTRALQGLDSLMFDNEHDPKGYFEAQAIVEVVKDFSLALLDKVNNKTFEIV